MHQQLIVIPPIAASVPMCLADAEIAAAIGYAEQEKSPGTRRAYGSDWRAFSAFCDARGLEAMPATPGTAARFLSLQADSGLKASTIGRRAAAIAYFHKLAGHEPPTGSEAVRATVRGIRRTIGTAPDRKAPATADLILDMLTHCPPTLAGKRDRALLALGFAGAFRRSELVALTVADLVEAPDGFRVHHPAQQDGPGRGGAGGRHPARLQDPPGRGRPGVAGHSLRAGFLTSAAESGASVLKMVEVSRHKSIDMLRTYVRRADLFREHAGAAFL